MSNRPYEIIAAPYTLWVAAVGAVFPTIDEDPGVSWTKVGTNGDLNYSEDGVTVTHSQTLELLRVLGSAGPRKAFRTEEEMHVTLTLLDLTLEQYAIALNYNTVTTVPPDTGESGYKKLGLSRGLSVEHRALLVRGLDASSYMTGGIAQYEVPVAVQMGEAEVVFSKGEPAGLALDFVALEDPDAATEDERFGRLIIQNTEAGT